MIPTCTRLLVLLLLMILSGCGSSNDPTRPIDFIPLKSIEITSQHPRIAVGTSNHFTAIGHFGDPTTFQFTRDITGQVAWVSSDAAVLSFSADPASAGLASAVTAGTVTVTATFSAMHAGLPLTVSSELPFTVSTATITALSIPPPATTVVAGETLQLRAEGTYSDSSVQDLTEVVTWSSSDPAVATVGADSGLLTGLGAGTIQISADFEGLSASQTIEIVPPSLTSIAVTSVGGGQTLALKTTMRLIATGTYANATSKDLTSLVTWVSSNPAVATVDQSVGTNGKMSPVAAGSTTVTATLEGITSPGFQITVNSATLSSLALSPTAPTLPVGETVQLKATGTFSNGFSQDVSGDVLWSSADETIATVSLSTGLEGTVKGIGAGKVAITANSNTIPTTTTGTAIVTSTEVTVQ